MRFGGYYHFTGINFHLWVRWPVLPVVSDQWTCLAFRIIMVTLRRLQASKTSVACRFFCSNPQKISKSVPAKIITRANQRPGHSSGRWSWRVYSNTRPQINAGTLPAWGRGKLSTARLVSDSCRESLATREYRAMATDTDYQGVWV